MLLGGQRGKGTLALHQSSFRASRVGDTHFNVSQADKPVHAS
jgi:hypothetical protein